MLTGKKTHIGGLVGAALTATDVAASLQALRDDKLCSAVIAG